MIRIRSIVEDLYEFLCDNSEVKHIEYHIVLDKEKGYTVNKVLGERE